MADPEFPRRGWQGVGGVPTPEFRAQTNYLVRFLPKLVGVRKSLAPLSDRPMSFLPINFKENIVLNPLTSSNILYLGLLVANMRHHY